MEAVEDDKNMQPMRTDSIQFPDENSEQNRNQWRRYAAVGSMCGFLVCMVYVTQTPSAEFQIAEFQPLHQLALHSGRRLGDTGA